MRSLCFDLDGTLTDPREGIVRCLRHALESIGAACPSDQVLASFIGPPLRSSLRTLLGAAATDQALRRALSLYRQRYDQRGYAENLVYPGVPELLARAARSAQALYVVTSKPTIFARRILELFHLAPHFTEIYGAELDGRFDDKAELLAHVLAERGLAGGAAVMIGDRAIDISAGRASGTDTIGVLWGYGSREELSTAGAQEIVASPAELADLLESRSG